MLYLFKIFLLLTSSSLQVNSLCSDTFSVTNLTEDGVTETSVTLSWSAVDLPDCNVTYPTYDVIVEDTSDPMDPGRVFVTTKKKSTTISGLEPCRAYKVSVANRFETGTESKNRADIIIKTLPDVVKVSSLIVKNITQNSVMVYWLAPPRDECYGKSNKYSVKLEYNRKSLVKTNWTWIRGTAMIALSNLEICTSYKISVAVISDDIVSKEESSKVFQTLPGSIQVRDLTVTEITATSAVVSWIPPVRDHVTDLCFGAGNNYSVRLDPFPGRKTPENRTWIWETTCIQLLELQPSSMYRVSITVVSSGPLFEKKVAILLQTPSALTAFAVTKRLPASGNTSLSMTHPHYQLTKVNVSLCRNTTVPSNVSEERGPGLDSTAIPGYGWISTHKVAIAILVPVSCALVALTSMCLLLRYRGLQVGRHRFDISERWCFSESGSTELEEYNEETFGKGTRSLE